MVLVMRFLAISMEERVRSKIDDISNVLKDMKLDLRSNDVCS